MISFDPSGLSSRWRSIASQNRTDSFAKIRKRDFVVLFAAQNKQWRLIFLTASFGSFLGKLGDENQRSHVPGVAVRKSRLRFKRPLIRFVPRHLLPWEKVGNQAALPQGSREKTGSGCD